MSTTPLVLDTTYVLPIFEIAVDLSPPFSDELRELWKKGSPGYEIFLPSTCLLECAYKLRREFLKQGDPAILMRYAQNLPVILSSTVVKIIDPIISPEMSDVAMKINSAGHPDLMDCWIAACAVFLNGTLLTQDVTLREFLQKLPETKDLCLWSWTDFQDNKK